MKAKRAKKKHVNAFSYQPTRLRGLYEALECTFAAHTHPEHLHIVHACLRADWIIIEVEGQVATGRAHNALTNSTQHMVSASGRRVMNTGVWPLLMQGLYTQVKGGERK